MKDIAELRKDLTEAAKDLAELQTGGYESDDQSHAKS